MVASILPILALLDLTAVPPPVVPPRAPVIGRPLLYPYPLLPIRPRTVVRCEQDRLLTDTRPCGEEAAEPADDRFPPSAPPPLKRCEMDRLLTDRTPCTR